MVIMLRHARDMLCIKVKFGLWVWSLLGGTRLPVWGPISARMARL